MVTWSPGTHSLKMNGPVPTMSWPWGSWPWAYLLFASGVLSALPALSAVGLSMPNTARVEASSKLDCGVLSVMTTVCSSGAVTEATLEADPKPPKTAP